MSTPTNMNAASYSHRQRERDAQYRREYAAWMATLSEEERLQLKAKGLDAPFLPGASSGRSDAASSSRARCEAGEIEGDDGDEDEDHTDDACHGAEEAAAFPGQETQEPASSEPEPAPTQPADHRILLRLLRRLVGELAMQDHVRLSLECLALVTGLSYDGFSMTAIARRHGVTRAAVSKRCVELTQALGLPPSRAMRSPKARTRYRSARTVQLRHTA